MIVGCASASHLYAQDPLPSWKEGSSKQTLTQFVSQATAEGTPGFVPIPERIAVFDNDGTLWCEQPAYSQALFIFDRIKELAPQHPEWKSAEPFASVLRGDMKAALAGGERALLEMVMATHASMTTAEFEAVVENWLATARHPKTGKPYTEMVYQPMLELLDYLRANGFKTYIVSGGGIEFMRPWTDSVYGIPPEQVIGSSIKTKFEVRNGTPVLVRIPELDFIDDKEGKPVAINSHIGRRPCMAFGNSDGDFQMLEWTTAGEGPSLGVFIHHDDSEREVAYDRDSPIGKLARGLDESAERGWTVVSMKRDWAQVYPGDSPATDDLSMQSIIGNWLCEDIDKKGVIDIAQSTLELKPDGTVAGNTSVNRYSGTVEISDNNFALGPLATTRRAGPPALMDQESRFLAALAKAKRFVVDENEVLTMFDEEQNAVLRFTKTTR